MATFYVRTSVMADNGEKEKEVTDQWPLPSYLQFRRSDNGGDSPDLDPYIPVTPGNPLPVAVMGTVVTAPARRIVSFNFFAAAAGDYAALDMVSNNVTDNQAQAYYLPNIVDKAGDVAILDSITSRCNEDSVLWRLRLHFYRENPLPSEVEMDDNIAADFAKTAGGYNKYIGFTDLAAAADMGTALAYAQVVNLRQLIKTGGAATGVWVVVQTLDAEANETAAMRLDFDLSFLN